MSVAATIEHAPVLTLHAHPNEIDLRRITRAIEKRDRYRYVEPKVSTVNDAYLVRSANCSRNVDPSGGEIDIALIAWDGQRGEWSLMRKDHQSGSWIEDSRYARLPDLLLRLNADPKRSFWQ